MCLRLVSCRKWDGKGGVTTYVTRPHGCSGLYVLVSFLLGQVSYGICGLLAAMLVVVENDRFFIAEQGKCPSASIEEPELIARQAAFLAESFPDLIADVRTLAGKHGSFLCSLFSIVCLLACWFW